MAVGGGGLGYVSCFRDFDVCFVCLGSGCGGVGGANGEECCRELLEVGICGMEGVWESIRIQVTGVLCCCNMHGRAVFGIL